MADLIEPTTKKARNLKFKYGKKQRGKKSKQNVPAPATPNMGVAEAAPAPLKKGRKRTHSAAGSDLSSSSLSSISDSDSALPEAAKVDAWPAEEVTEPVALADLGLDSGSELTELPDLDSLRSAQIGRAHV